MVMYSARTARSRSFQVAVRLMSSPWLVNSSKGNSGGIHPPSLAIVRDRFGKLTCRKVLGEGV
jgi:hypothetical protein